MSASNPRRSWWGVLHRRTDPGRPRRAGASAQPAGAGDPAGTARVPEEGELGSGGDLLPAGPRPGRSRLPAAFGRAGRAATFSAPPPWASGTATTSRRSPDCWTASGSMWASWRRWAPARRSGPAGRSGFQRRPVSGNRQYRRPMAATDIPATDRQDGPDRSRRHPRLHRGSGTVAGIEVPARAYRRVLPPALVLALG